MNERMRLNPAEASAAGLQDAQALLQALADIEQSTNPAELVGDSLAGIIGPALRDAVGTADQMEALRAKCALLSASLRQAEAQAAGITDSEGGEL